MFHWLQYGKDIFQRKYINQDPSIVNQRKNEALHLFWTLATFVTDLEWQPIGPYMY